MHNTLKADSTRLLIFCPKTTYSILVSPRRFSFCSIRAVISTLLASTARFLSGLSEPGMASCWIIFSRTAPAPKHFGIPESRHHLHLLVGMNPRNSAGFSFRTALKVTPEKSLATSLQSADLDQRGPSSCCSRVEMHRSISAIISTGHPFSVPVSLIKPKLK
jgi:hypothetical protein